MIINGTFTYVTRDAYHKACPKPGGMTQIHCLHLTPSPLKFTTMVQTEDDDSETEE